MTKPLPIKLGQWLLRTPRRRRHCGGTVRRKGCRHCSTLCGVATHRGEGVGTTSGRAPGPARSPTTDRARGTRQRRSGSSSSRRPGAGGSKAAPPAPQGSSTWRASLGCSAAPQGLRGGFRTHHAQPTPARALDHRRTAGGRLTHDARGQTDWEIQHLMRQGASRSKDG